MDFGLHSKLMIEVQRTVCFQKYKPNVKCKILLVQIHFLIYIFTKVIIFPFKKNCQCICCRVGFSSVRFSKLTVWGHKCGLKRMTEIWEHHNWQIGRNRCTFATVHVLSFFRVRISPRKLIFLVVVVDFNFFRKMLNALAN